MRILLKAGAKPMALNLAGLHPLAEAASTGQVAALALLVDEAGVAADARDRHGLNALHAAALHRHDEAVSWLRQRGAVLPHPLTQVLLDRPADPLPWVR
jgi:ankyrin repeat protein